MPTLRGRHVASKANGVPNKKITKKCHTLWHCATPTVILCDILTPRRLSASATTVYLQTIYEVLPNNICCWGYRGYRIEKVEREPHSQDCVFLTHRLRASGSIASHIAKQTTYAELHQAEGECHDSQLHLDKERRICQQHAATLSGRAAQRQRGL